MITNIDENVGKLRRLLEETGLADNTVFLFTTDNGTAAGDRKRPKEDGTWPGYNAGMRGKKGSEHDGRTPRAVLCAGPRATSGAAGHRRPGGARRRDADADRAVRAEARACGSWRRRVVRGRAARREPAPMCSHPVRALAARRAPSHVAEVREVMTQRWRLINGERLFDMRLDPDNARTSLARTPRPSRSCAPPMRSGGDR